MTISKTLEFYDISVGVVTRLPGWTKEKSVFDSRRDTTLKITYAKNFCGFKAAGA